MSKFPPSIHISSAFKFFIAALVGAFFLLAVVFVQSSHANDVTLKINNGYSNDSLHRSFSSFPNGGIEPPITIARGTQGKYILLKGTGANFFKTNRAFFEYRLGETDLYMKVEMTAGSTSLSSSVKCSYHLFGSSFPCTVTRNEQGLYQTNFNSTTNAILDKVDQRVGKPEIVDGSIYPSDFADSTAKLNFALGHYTSVPYAPVQYWVTYDTSDSQETSVVQNAYPESLAIKEDALTVQLANLQSGSVYHYLLYVKTAWGTQTHSGTFTMP